MDGCPRPSAGGGEAPRFLADAMLGRLARWLRILGYDVEYFPGEDDELVHQARREGRILLTRDTRLVRRHQLPPHVFIQSDHVMEQLRQVVASLRLDPAARAVTVAGAGVTLTVKEFELLWFFARHPRQVFSRSQLLDRVWGHDFAGDPATVTVHIRRLREKVERDPSAPRRLLTVWGVGYKFEP